MKTTVINIPEFRLALVLGGRSTTSTTRAAPLLNSEEIESLRRTTEQYVLHRLCRHHPHLQSFTLTFEAPTGEHKTPDPRFHVYCQGLASAVFSSRSPPNSKSISHQQQKPTIISRDTLFRNMGEAFKDGSTFLNTLECTTGIQATEVEVRLFERPTAGGVVKAPNFYMGFECHPAPTQKPTPAEIRSMIGLVYPTASEELHKAYSDDFVGLDNLRIVKTEINEAAGKPFVKFNLYVEFEALGTFERNTPAPMEFYGSISKILSPTFMDRLVETVSGDCRNAIRMAMNPVAYIENLHEDVGDVDADIVPVHVEFWIALVVNDMNAEPNEEEMMVYDQMMETFVDERLAAVYGRTKYQGFKTFGPACEVEYNRGLPLPRFNILRKYKTDINMRNPVPHPTAILGKIVNCDIGSLLFRIISLEDDCCWTGTREATMGFADVAKKAINALVFGGKRLLTEAQQTARPHGHNDSHTPTAPDEGRKATKPLNRKPKDVLPPPPKSHTGSVGPKTLPNRTKVPQTKPKAKTTKTLNKKLKDMLPPSPKSQIGSVGPKTLSNGKKVPQAKQDAKPTETTNRKPKDVLPHLPKTQIGSVGPKTLSNGKKVPQSKPEAKPRHVSKTDPADRADGQPSEPSANTRPTNVPQTKSETKPNPVSKINGAYRVYDDPIESSANIERQPERRIREFGIFTALSVNDRGDGREPTPQEYEALAEATSRFYMFHLNGLSGDHGVDKVDVSVRKTAYKTCQPNKHYNVYVEWDVALTPAAAAAAVHDGGLAMDNCSLNRVFVAKVKMMDFLSKYIRSLSGTIFEQATGISMGLVED